MGVVLRVDVDKPYGNHTILRKIFSKFMEDFIGLSLTKSPFYLTHQIQFLQYCNSHDVRGYFYYRNCTIPNGKVTKLMQEGKHQFGFHAENTRSFDTFESELKTFRNKLQPLKIQTFSKHGSGVIKLGKNHYPPFEPIKYKEWAGKLNCAFPSGNDICENGDNLTNEDGYHDKIFWIEPEYRHENFNKIEQLVKVAKEKKVVILIHPENFVRSKIVADEFRLLVDTMKANEIKWDLF